MADIDAWLDQFRNGWISKDVDAVLDLFTDDVVYYETPFERLEGKESVREEWETIHEQEDIDLGLDVYAEDGNRYTILWTLSYGRNGDQHRLQGVYLVTLTSGNLCSEFWQYTEEPEL